MCEYISDVMAGVQNQSVHTPPYLCLWLPEISLNHAISKTRTGHGLIRSYSGLHG